MYESVRKSRPHVLVVDAGNLFGMRRESEKKQSEFLAEHTAALGYDVFGVGEWDLNYGLDFLRQIEQKHGFTFVNANLHRGNSKELVFPPYAVREIAGLKVGFISVLSPRYKIVTMTSEPDDFTADSPRDALDRYLPELRQKADLIVLLAQMPSAEVRQLLVDLGKDSGLDICVEGHDPKQYRRPNWVEDVLLLAANNQGKYIGQMDAMVSPEGVIDRESVQITIHALDQNSPEIESIVKEVDEFKAKLDAESGKVTSFDHPRTRGAASEKFLGMHTCARCHSEAAKVYSQSGHARAFQTLQAKGQENNPECVSCHVVGFDYVNGYDRVADPKVPGREQLKNVQCEACHGYGTTHERGNGWAAAAKASCTTCHDAANSPDFDYATYWAKIAH